MKYRYIFVDLDNTLLDFEAAEEYSFYYTAQSRGLSFGEAELERYQAINAPLWKMMERREITKDALVVRRFRELFEDFTIYESFLLVILQDFHLHAVLDFQLIHHKGAVYRLAERGGGDDTAGIHSVFLHQCAKAPQSRGDGANAFKADFRIAEHLMADGNRVLERFEFRDFAFSQLGDPHPQQLGADADSGRGARSFFLDAFDCFHNVSSLSTVVLRTAKKFTGSAEAEKFGFHGYNSIIAIILQTHNSFPCHSGPKARRKAKFYRIFTFPDRKKKILEKFF